MCQMTRADFKSVEVICDMLALARHREGEEPASSEQVNQLVARVP